MNDRPVQPPDPTRRRFFRQFAGDVVSSVGSVIGAAQVLQQQSAEAARELLGPETPTSSAGGAPGVPAASSAALPTEEDASAAGYRAAFRWDDDVCHLVDQRRLPDTLVDLEVRGAADGVSAINDGAIVGSLAQAQLAAITLALVAGRTATHRPFARRATIRGAANALRTALPGSAAMAATVDRMLAVADELGLDAEGTEIAAAMHAEAEAVLREAGDALGALVGHAVGVLPGEPAAEGPAETGAAETGDAAEAGEGAEGAEGAEAGEAPPPPLMVLTIGSTGAMGGGLCGTAVSAIIAAHHAGRVIHAVVAETRPGFDGSRIATWELRQAGVPCSILTDAAAPGRVASGDIGAVLVGADRVAANGDVVATAGTYPLALAAAAAGVPFLVCAPTLAVDLAAPDGRACTLEEGRAGRILMAAGTRIAPQGTPVHSPAQDLTPAALVTAIITEAGVVHPPFGPGLATPRVAR